MAGEEGALTGKTLRRALKARIPYLVAHKEDLSVRQLRRLLEADLKLDANALDEELWKSQIKAHVDEARSRQLAARGAVGFQSDRPDLEVAGAGRCYPGRGGRG